MFRKKPKQNIIIFTDLDGTLLDHNSYDFSEALEMLSYIKHQDIPLILTTSKTKIEVLKLQNKLDISYPFIVENGAGIFIPINDTNDFDVINLGIPYDKTIEAFLRYSKEFNITGFHQMNNEQVANLTGLSLKDATYAKQRSYGEPFLFEDTKDYIYLREIVRKDGFDIVKGGRFYHLISQNIDKANALKELKSIYEDTFKTTFKTIALGDGNNDLTMLDCVDIPVLIPTHDGSYIFNTIDSLTKAKYPGPKGWNASLKGLLNAH